MPAIEAWIITLNPRSDSVTRLSADLSSQGFKVQCYDAVDGRQQTPVFKDGEKISYWRALVNRKARLTNSEVGCYLSHYRLIKQAYSKGLSHVVIFEDDIGIEEGLYDVVQKIVRLGPQFHLVRLMALKIRKRTILKSLSDDYDLVRATRGTLGTQGYVLNRQGMRKIIRFGATMRMPIDKLYDSFFLYGLNCYNVEPHIIYEQAHPSSVVKTADGLSDSFVVNLAWRINKLYRSIMRRVNYLININDYKGATKPDYELGKSVRLRN